jgi:hypothetical protein
MKPNRTILILFSLIAVLSLALSACGAKDTGPVVVNVTGMVDKPAGFSDAALHKLKTATVTTTAPKQDAAEDFTGVRFSDLMDKVKVQSGATTMVLTASDGFSAEVALADLTACTDCMIAFTDTVGTVRAVMPGMSNKAWVKGLASIEFK